MIATGGEAGAADAEDIDLYRLFQAADILGCTPWALARQPVFWRERAFWYREVNYRAAEIAEKIQAQREEVANRDYE